MAAKKGLQTDAGVTRCWWCGEHEDYRAYHDNEWGRPVGGDRPLFEKLCLEGFQSGLSWLTILRKREGFRRAFRGFDFESVARFNTRSVERLLKDASIVRHRGKIEATVNNAKRALELIDEKGSLAAHVWSFEPPASERPRRMDHATLSKLAETPASRALSKDLKKRGWAFVGPTTCYAFLQSVGVVNDHLEGCSVRAEVEAERRAFRRPG
ncbi:MAG: DNA-3-methyladenine glycosylase I [Planctomycetota bacterium]